MCGGGFILDGVFTWEVLKKWTLASSWGRLGKVLFTRWLNTTKGQHTKPFFKDLPRKITIFKLDSVPQGGPKMVPRWLSMAQDGFKMTGSALKRWEFVLSVSNRGRGSGGGGPVGCPEVGIGSQRGGFIKNADFAWEVHQKRQDEPYQAYLLITAPPLEASRGASRWRMRG